MSAIARGTEFRDFIGRYKPKRIEDDQAVIPCPLKAKDRCRTATVTVRMMSDIPQVRGDEAPDCGCSTVSINGGLAGAWNKRSKEMLSRASTVAAATSPAVTPADPKAEEQHQAEEQRQAEDEIHNTDLGNAKRLVGQHGEDLRYSAGLGWLIWDHNRWVQDETQEVMRRAKKTALSLYAGIPEVKDKEDREELISWARQSESRPKLESMIKLAESEKGIPVRDDQLDADRFLLNVLNGVVDLRSGTLKKHQREWLLTKLVPIEYNPKATCPTFLDFLHTVLNGNEELVAFVQRAVGYTLTGDVSEQCLLFLYGMGANGKSTLLNVLLALLGDYATQAAPGLLLDRRTDKHTTDIAELRGKRLVVATEIGEGKRLAEELVKQMTGGDRMKGRFMRCNNIEFNPEFKIWLSANHKPTIRGTDHAIWRRIPLIPFEVTFTDDAEDPRFRKDPHLLGKLLEELPGILAWAVQGCLDWQKQGGLNAPEAVRKATAAYRAEMDVLGEFLDDHCTLSDKCKVKAATLYAEYSTWMAEAGEKPITSTAFSLRLQERGIKPHRDRTSRWYLGIGLVADSSTQARTADEKVTGSSDGDRFFVPGDGFDPDSRLSRAVLTQETVMLEKPSQPVTTPNLSHPQTSAANGGPPMEEALDGGDDEDLYV